MQPTKPTQTTNEPQKKVVDDAITSKSTTEQTGNIFTFNRLERSITIHNPHGESTEVVWKDKYELVNGSFLEVLGFKEDGQITFRQEDGAIYQGHFNKIVWKCDQGMNDPIQR